jgi:hypothetical protein
MFSSNCKNVESNVLTDFFNLQRRARIQNLSNLAKKLPLRSLTMHGAVSKEITEIIWILERICSDWARKSL